MKEINNLLENALNEIDTAQLLLQNNKINAAVSRAYYAVFYAVQGILLTKGVTLKTHQGLQIMFSNHFIKTSVLPKEYAKYLNECLDKRIIGDYELGHGLNNDDASQSIELAKEIIDGITKYLKDNRFID